MKERIIELIEDYEQHRILTKDAFADEIMQLKIECPDTEEIDKEAELYAPVSLWERLAFRVGAEYIKNEIARRNQ